MKMLIVSVLAAFATIQLMANPCQAVTCGDIEDSLLQCYNYLTQGGNPSPTCCKGGEHITDIVKTTEDKRISCNCMKNVASKTLSIKVEFAQALPGKCSIHMNIPISKNTNCDAIQFAPNPTEAVSCGDIDASLTPCLTYLTQGGTPSKECCKGVLGISNMAKSTADKKEACKCVKAAANKIESLNDAAAQALPAQCNVQLDIPVSRNTVKPSTEHDCLSTYLKHL